MNKDCFIPSPTKISRKLINDLEEFFGAAFQQVIRSSWICNQGTLVFRTFIVLNTPTEGEDGNTVNTDSAYELIDYTDDDGDNKPMSFDFGEGTVSPTGFSVTPIVTDLPSHAITFNLRVDELPDGPVWSVSATDMETMEQVRMEGDKDSMLGLVSDPNHPETDDLINRHLSFLFGYRLDQSKVYIPLHLVPPGNVISWFGEEYLVTMETLLSKDGIELSIDDVPENSIVEWPSNGKVIMDGITRITSEAVEFIEGVVRLNRRHLRFNVEDPMALVDISKQAHVAMLKAVVDDSKPSVMRLTFDIQSDTDDLELHVTGGPVSIMGYGGMALINDIVGGKDWLNDLEGIRDTMVSDISPQFTHGDYKGWRISSFIDTNGEIYLEDTVLLNFCKWS